MELEADVFRLVRASARSRRRVIRLCRPLKRTALLPRQPYARQFFGNYPIRADSRFCTAHPYTDKSRRCDSHSTLEGRTEVARLFERRSPRSGSNTSQGRQLSACWPPDLVNTTTTVMGRPGLRSNATPSLTAYIVRAMMGRNKALGTVAACPRTGLAGAPPPTRSSAKSTSEPGCLLLAQSGRRQPSQERAFASFALRRTMVRKLRTTLEESLRRAAMLRTAFGASPFRSL